MYLFKSLPPWQQRYVTFVLDLCVRFTLILLQGFRIPVEDNSEKDGTEFVDIEAGGFDNGQGDMNTSSLVDTDNLVSGHTALW